MNIKLFLSILSILCITGCINTKDPVIETTKLWENHYYSVEDFQNGTKNIQLEKGESIWVISNRTLSRVLKNYINNQK